MTPHICILTPGHLSTNPRVVKEARALHDAGYRITIVCGSYLPWGAEHDRALASSDWRVVSTPFGRRMARPAVHVRQKATQVLARALARMGMSTPAVSAAAHSPVALDLAAATSKIKADLYIGHYVAALPAAARAARLHGASYAFDAEDFHLGDLPERPEYDFEKRLIRSIEERFLRGAAFLTAAAPLIGEAYAHTYEVAAPTVLLNVFPRTHAAPAPTECGSVEPGPSLYWFSQTIGPGRGLETALEGAALAQSRPHLYLRGAVSADYRSHLAEHAVRLGIADRLHFLEPCAPGELERDGAQFDVGYCGETGFSLNNDKALANKLFSYLSSGIAICASSTTAHRQVSGPLGEAMTVVPIANGKALAKALDDLLLNSSRLAQARQASWSLGAGRFCWEEEQKTLLRLVEQYLKKVA
ncbi:glycosyltransferase involved in cell wall biosynthesis [Rhodoblastus acidophilus]|uniref:glycosyltransferase n=1 Tax=Rhodoblastus acidophilus TaxID=1074 RepID=UPI0022246693|nr:glycosyltransferase [Rhodoblastus acidophilus]MCW2284294.1 glycosyltransferase involved in cell wall biosynthesis [Rhodoblastus acidophilus]MCW2333228.1 glycosyltransferase involved in cell wall biosynthesis [Rhodoblastus acidophilus]